MLRHNNCKIDTLVIHCTATPPKREVTVKELDSWHKAEKFEPYTKPDGTKVYAGYHILVHLDGSYERIRPDEHRGQHCPVFSLESLSVRFFKSLCGFGVSTFVKRIQIDCQTHVVG